MNDDVLSDADDHDSGRGLLFGVLLDGHGGARNISLDEARAWKPRESKETLWLHIDVNKPGIQSLLETSFGISEQTAETLVSEKTRPRSFHENGALIATLRGVNFNPGAEPEDMVSLRLWADGNRVLTLRLRRLQTPRDVLAELSDRRGPRNSGELVAELIEKLVAKLDTVIDDLNDQIDELENHIDAEDIDRALDQITSIRRDCLSLKRHMLPQTEALISMNRDAPDWLHEGNRRDIRETVARLQRYIDDLDVSRESAVVIQDDLNARANSRSNKTMYMLSIVAAIFLPLGFVTGLLGINVGGIPGVNSPVAFWIVIGGLVLIGSLQLYIFRKLKWL